MSDAMDIDLDAPPAITRRDMIEEAYGALASVLTYDFDLIKDQIIRSRIIRAHELLRDVLKGT